METSIKKPSNMCIIPNPKATCPLACEAVHHLSISCTSTLRPISLFTLFFKTKTTKAVPIIVFYISKLNYWFSVFFLVSAAGGVWWWVSTILKLSILFRLLFTKSCSLHFYKSNPFACSLRCVLRGDKYEGFSGVSAFSQLLSYCFWL